MILITGSSGFIASAFCKKLYDNNIYFGGYDLPNDIIDINKLDVRIPDMLIHFAAIANLNDSIADQDKNFEVNIRGTYEVAKFCVKNNIPLIFISTCCVYHSNDMVDETIFPLTSEP